MHSPVSLVPAAQFSLSQLARLINDVYADYHVPIWMEAAQLGQMCREVAVLLEASPVAVVAGEPVGLTLFSRRGERGWLSAVGVLPRWRRQHIARQLATYCQQIARQLGLCILTLEALTQNEAAMNLYQHLGFVWQRDLLVLLQEPGTDISGSSSPEIVAAAPADLLAHHAAFHDIPTCWQREVTTLWARRNALEGLQWRVADRCTGYVLYQFQPRQCMIHDLAVDPTCPQRVEIARALLLAVQRLQPHLSGQIINVPLADPLVTAFPSLGYRIWQRQYEMVWNVESA